MEQRGFTLIEVLIVVGLIGLVAMLGVPRLGRALVRQSVSGAREAVVGMHTKARASAIQRGRPVRLVFSANTLVIRSQHPVTGVIDTVGEAADLGDRYGVRVTSSRDSLLFDARGLGTEGSATTITVAKGAYTDQVVINQWGRLVR